MDTLRRDANHLRTELASQTVTVAKYKRMVGEISRLIDWAQGSALHARRRPGEIAAFPGKPSLAR